MTATCTRIIHILDGANTFATISSRMRGNGGVAFYLVSALLFIGACSQGRGAEKARDRELDLLYGDAITYFTQLRSDLTETKTVEEASAVISRSYGTLDKLIIQKTLLEEKYPVLKDPQKAVAIHLAQPQSSLLKQTMRDFHLFATDLDKRYNHSVSLRKTWQIAFDKILKLEKR